MVLKAYPAVYEGKTRFKPSTTLDSFRTPILLEAFDGDDPTETHAVALTPLCHLHSDLGFLFGVGEKLRVYSGEVGCVLSFSFCVSFRLR